MSLHSALYSASVMHRRFRPVAHHLRYRVYSLLLDLDDLETLHQRLRVFSVNRFNLFSFQERAHGDGRPSGLSHWVREQLAAAGLPHDGRILLLTMPRILGYAFNPVSLYFCHNRSGELTAMLYEVNNTFGERHTYLLEAEPQSAGEDIRQSCPKVFHVSPFLGLNMGYQFTVRPPQTEGDELLYSIKTVDPQGCLLVATYRAEHHPLSDASLLWHFVRYPLLTLKVITAIHWEALKLWLKGVKVIRKPDPPRQALTLIRTRTRKAAP